MQRIRAFFLTLLLCGALVALLQGFGPPPVRSSLRTWEATATQRLIGLWEEWQPTWRSRLGLENRE